MLSGHSCVDRVPGWDCEATVQSMLHNSERGCLVLTDSLAVWIRRSAFALHCDAMAPVPGPAMHRLPLRAVVPSCATMPHTFHGKQCLPC